MTEIVTNNTLDPRSTRASVIARLQPWFTEARALLSLGLPLIATQLAHMAMPTTDILMLGVLGQEALAAAALATTAYVFLWLIGLGPASAVAPVIAQIVGANPSDRARVRVALRMGFWSVLMLCVPIGIGLFFAEEALLALGQAPELARLAGPYVQVLSLGLPFSFGFNVLRNFSTALGRPRPPLAIMCAGVLLNIVLDYALIFGRFGMPEMGMIGAAFSTALVTAFCFSRWRAL